MFHPERSPCGLEGRLGSYLVGLGQCVVYKIHGTGTVYLPTFTIKINETCRQIESLGIEPLNVKTL